MPCWSLREKVVAYPFAKKLLSVTNTFSAYI